MEAIYNLARFSVPTTPPECDAEEALRLLAAVLPTFVAVAKTVAANLSDSYQQERNDVKETENFYCEYFAKTFGINAFLQTSDLDSVSTWPDATIKLFRQLLDSLDTAFVSTSKCIGIVEMHRELGFERRKNESHKNLRALFRILPEDNEWSENSLAILIQFIRPYKKRSVDRATILGYLDLAFDLLMDMHLQRADAPECPRHFAKYPVKHIRRFSKILFDVLGNSWSCDCNTRPHIQRAMKLNLTQHQRFETVSLQGNSLAQQDALFRIMFPTKSRSPSWQDTDVIVKERISRGKFKTEINKNFCGIIENTKSNIVPNIMVYEQRLWQMRPAIDPSGPIKIPDGEFTTLADLLKQSQGRASLLSTIPFKERVILSVIIVTTFLHLYKIDEHDLQAMLTIDTICFQVKHHSFSIKRPYLNIQFMRDSVQSKLDELTEVHCLPDVLSLGILLLQVLRGTPLEMLDNQDRCWQALSARDIWRKIQGRASAGTVPDGCFDATSACLDPTQLQDNGLDLIDTKDESIRQYVFERVLYPLEEVLLDIYHIPLRSLCDTNNETHGEEAIVLTQLTEKEIAGRGWRRQLEGVHNAMYHTFSKRLPKDQQRENSVKIAILDTGLQLADALQENYIAEGRISSADCKSFCTSEWNFDTDGHGSCIAQIILDAAPHAEVYIAKICERRKDFKNKHAIEVQTRIAQAIHHAATVWEVDVIIMSFGFDERVPVINQAMEQSTRAKKQPLYFAATCNDAAHKPIAWPAREANVFGISSTDGDGHISTFNPHDNEAYPIFYAFGDGVEVQCKDANGNFSTKFISGTSFATPIAAALVANLLTCVRLGIKTLSPDDAAIYVDLPRELQQMNNMVKVMRHCMQTKNQQKESSLLPWDLLKAPVYGDGGLLQTVLNTLNKC